MRRLDRFLKQIRFFVKKNRERMVKTPFLQPRNDPIRSSSHERKEENRVDNCWGNNLAGGEDGAKVNIYHGR